MTYTHQQIEDVVRSVERTCRGNYIHSKDYRDTYYGIFNKIADSKDKNAYAAGLDLVRSMEQENGVGAVDLPKGDWQKLTIRMLELLNARDGNCGYDFNTTILNGPLDGRIVQYTCPKCGVAGEYQSPNFTE